MPESVQYIRKAVINCPVDVEVYTSDGTLITVLKDGVESDITNEYGRFAVVYQPYTEEYAKVICQSTNEKLKFRLTANSDGLVDFKLAELIDGKITIVGFDNVKIMAGSVIEITSSTENRTYLLDYDGDGKFEETAELTVKDTENYVIVESITVDKKELDLKIGETSVAGVTISPTDATNKHVDWMSMDDNVATVQNGKITAVGSGTTTVYASARDADNIVDVIIVNVTDSGASIPED